MLIEQKARDMLRHYINVVFPEGFKAQVVATSRDAACHLWRKVGAGKDRVGERSWKRCRLRTLALAEEEVEKLDRKQPLPCSYLSFARENSRSRDRGGFLGRP